jgi:siderophore ferric iron reductase
MKEVTQAQRVEFERLDAMCQQITPYLAGTIDEADITMLAGKETDLQVIQSLFNDIKSEHPEADKGYWLTRTCELLFWQPVYISMVSIYELHKSIHFSTFAQRHTGPYVMGYRFQSIDFMEGEVMHLIDHAGNQIKVLLDHYQILFDSWSRCRTGFIDQLLADFILASLKRLGELKPEINKAMIMHHAELWLSACHLPLKNLKSYSSQDDGSLHFIRRSCCQVYKTTSGELCSDCPRAKQRQLKREPRCTN